MPSENEIIQAISQLLPSTRREVALADGMADAIIQQGDRVILIEVKTGNSRYPLPSSTHSQMRQYISEVQDLYKEHRVVPLVVTNYVVDSEMKAELEADGIKVIEVRNSLSDVTRQVAAAVRGDDQTSLGASSAVIL